MKQEIVTVTGATGYLGLKIVKALLSQGARVKAMVRVTSDRSNLQALGVTDFVVGDMMDRGSLKAALAQSPKADALVASAAGYTGHSKGDSVLTDTEGYKNLVDACKEAGVPRFVLISILECDKAVTVPHFYHKYVVEERLKKENQPFIALRAGAFLDQARDMVLPQVKEGIYPELFPGVSLGMIYAPDLARYAAIAATSLPDTALGRSVDVGWETPASGSLLAHAFSNVLGKQVASKPMIPPVANNDMSAMMAWVGTGAYVSRNPQIQKELFGELPTVEEAVRRYCRDRGLYR